jgi:hypothetical protein
VRNPGARTEASAMKQIRVVSVGLGPIGLAAARLALSKTSLKLVGAVDPAPDKAGTDLGELLGTKPNGVEVMSDAAKAYERWRPDIILHCTSSFFPVVHSQLLEAARHGINVVTSAEELLVPDYQHHELAAELDAEAKTSGATILGTGVNPGFAMDFMAAVASAACYDVTAVRCQRVVDAGTRRLPLQRKVGAGLTVQEFEKRKAAGGFGHIGMEESVVLVGRALGWKLDNVEQSLQSVIAGKELETEHLKIQKGQVAGIRNVGSGWVGTQKVVELDLTMAVGSDNPRDVVRLESRPPIELMFKGGIAGDQATAAILVNSLRQVVEAKPGLVTVLDLPIPRLIR